MNYTAEANIPGILYFTMLFINIEKAFDNIKRDHIMKCFDYFASGDVFNWWTHIFCIMTMGTLLKITLLT